MIYFISDTHFNHDKEFIWKARGFNSVEEMNEAIINNWNNVVKPEDTIYILGDLFLGAYNGIMPILSRLSGRKILIFGNHDNNDRISIYTESGMFDDMMYATQIEYKDMKFYLTHYPSITYNFDFGLKNPKLVVINLFGHTHSTDIFYENYPNMYNVSCDANDCTPVSIEEIYRTMCEMCEFTKED